MRWCVEWPSFRRVLLRVVAGPLGAPGAVRALPKGWLGLHVVMSAGGSTRCLSGCAAVMSGLSVRFIAACSLGCCGI